MTVNEHEKHLFGELCWPCHVATHASFARQKQCPKCRRKWSYRNKQIEWKLLEAFCLAASAHHAARCVDVAYHTAYSSFRRFRAAILEMAEREKQKLFGEIEIDETYFGGRRKGRRGRGAAGKVIVFGLLERSGRVYSVVVPDVSKETLMARIRALSIIGSVFYSDEWKSCNDLHSYGKHRIINHQTADVEGRTHINGIEGFWSFSKQHYLKCHGVAKHNFALYLQEYEFRYNHRHDSLFSLLFPTSITIPSS